MKLTIWAKHIVARIQQNNSFHPVKIHFQKISIKKFFFGNFQLKFFFFGNFQLKNFFFANFHFLLCWNILVFCFQFFGKLLKYYSKCGFIFCFSFSFLFKFSSQWDSKFSWRSRAFFFQIFIFFFEFSKNVKNHITYIISYIL